MVAYAIGGTDLINNFMFSAPTERDVRMFQENHNSLIQSMQNATAGVANFYNSVANQIASIDYDRIKEFTTSIGRKLFTFWENDEHIIPLRTITDLQFPPQNMIRWLMANPVVRTKYHQNLVAGYDEKYVDLEPGLVGEDHHDFRMVMHGMEWEDDEGDVCYTTYEDVFDEPENSVEFLTMSEKLDIVDAWGLTNKYLEAMGEDPTSQYSGML